MKLAKLLLALTSAGLCGQWAVAEVLATGNTAEIERIQVSSIRAAYPVSTVPATITVIEQEQLKAQLAVTQDLSQILGNLIPAFSPSRQKLTANGETVGFTMSMARYPTWGFESLPGCELSLEALPANQVFQDVLDVLEVFCGVAQEYETGILITTL